MTATRPGALRRLADRLQRPGHAGVPPLDDPTPGRSTAEQVVPIGQVRPRQRVTVVGEVRTVALRPREDVPALDVELWDGTDALHLVWLGRRSIIGISPGAWLRATGRVTTQRRTVTIFNPAYEVMRREDVHD